MKSSRMKKKRKRRFLRIDNYVTMVKSTYNNQKSGNEESINGPEPATCRQDGRRTADTQSRGDTGGGNSCKLGERGWQEYERECKEAKEVQSVEEERRLS